MQMKKLSFLIVFGLFFIGCDLVYINGNEIEKNIDKSIEVYLSENVWMDGEISKGSQIDTYYISVTEGMRYFIYMNNAYDGDGTKTAHTICIIFDDRSVELWDFASNAANGVFSTPYAFTAVSTGTATITVASDSYENLNKGTGTYAIKYTSRPEYDFILSEGVWKDGEITAIKQINKYYINVTAGKKYSIRLNDAYDGDGTKTAHMSLSIYYSDGPAHFKGADKLYSKPYTFTATSTDVISVTVGYDYGWGEGTGTYAIKYEEVGINYLVENEWTDGEIFRDEQIDTYCFSVTKGMRYFVYMNNADCGDGTKTAYTGLKISHSDGTIICDSYYNLRNGNDPYTEPYAFTASSTGTVTITVASHNGNWETGTGTYAIIYACQQEYVLSEGVWKDDSIIPNGQTNKYYINVTAGKKYFIRLNSVHDGDGTKTAKAFVKISHSDGSYDDYVSELYSKPYTFTATSTGTVTVTVSSYDIVTGTYAIKYEEIGIDYLVENEWTNGEFLRWGQIDTYCISVTKGMRYLISMNNANYVGGEKTAYTGLKMSYGNGTVICDSYINVNQYSFVATSTGTVTITVASYYYKEWEKGTGTYAIKYTSRTTEDYELSEGEWKDDDIITSGQTNSYSINVISGKRYFIYINDAYEGDKTKTAYTGLRISHSDGTAICSNYDNEKKLYSNPYTFVVESNGTVTITVASYSNYYGWENGTGTYAIKYTSRTAEDYELSEGEWKDDEIIADGQTNRYSIYVTKGRQYFIYINGKGDGDGTKTAYAGLKISHSDGTTICSNYNGPYWLYSKPYTFTASSTGTVMITVSSYSYHYYLWERGTGTYAIKYTSRPEYYELSEGEWKDDEIIADGQTNKYSFDVTAGTKYKIYMNNKFSGDKTKTAYIGLKLSYSDGTIIYDNYVQTSQIDSNPLTFTVLNTVTVTITVASYYGGWEQGVGTYAIKYTTK